jgi:hypothetical protein
MPSFPVADSARRDQHFAVVVVRWQQAEFGED